DGSERPTARANAPARRAAGYRDPARALPPAGPRRRQGPRLPRDRALPGHGLDRRPALLRPERLPDLRNPARQPGASGCLARLARPPGAAHLSALLRGARAPPARPARGRAGAAGVSRAFGLVLALPLELDAAVRGRLAAALLVARRGGTVLPGLAP